MIRDFHGIIKSRLFDEIEALQDKIPAEHWRVIDSIRKIGNIGAHMEKDVDLIIDIDKDEADKLIKLIELLMRDWYINRYEQQKLYDEINDIADNKEKQKSLI